MAITFLSDEVINPTELRTNQRHWLDRATENVITIVNGRKQFALINRERICKLYAQKYYSELILKYCQEVNNKIESSTFPWTKYLNDEEKIELYNELLNTFSKSATIDDWSPVEHLLEDWQATAEINSDPKIAKALLAEEDPSKYVKLKG